MASPEETVTTYLSGNSTADSLMSTATRLAEPIRKAFQEGGTSTEELDFFSVWDPVIQAARKAAFAKEATPEHAALISLLAHIKASGVLIRDKDNTVCQHLGGVAWSDLPAFGASMREVWNDAPPTASAQEWESLNGFAARCTAAGVHDFSLYGLWALREALETSHPTTLRELGAAADSKNREATLEEVLPAAVAWIEVYGAGILRQVQEGKSFAKGGNAGDPGRPGRLAKEAGIEDSGFNEARWSFWQKRLSEISAAKDATGGREHVAKQSHAALVKLQALGKIKAGQA